MLEEPRELKTYTVIVECHVPLNVVAVSEEQAETHAHTMIQMWMSANCRIIKVKERPQ